MQYNICHVPLIGREGTQDTFRGYLFFMHLRRCRAVMIKSTASLSAQAVL